MEGRAAADAAAGERWRHWRSHGLLGSATRPRGKECALWGRSGVQLQCRRACEAADARQATVHGGVASAGPAEAIAFAASGGGKAGDLRPRGESGAFAVGRAAGAAHTAGDAHATGSARPAGAFRPAGSQQVPTASTEVS